MFILKMTCLGFRGTEDHTVGYRRKAAQLLGHTPPPAALSFSMDTNNSHDFKLAVGDTVGEALEIIRGQVAKHIGTIGWLNADLNDFFFEVATSDVKDGLFWSPGGRGTRAYRVSDCEEL